MKKLLFILCLIPLIAQADSISISEEYFSSRAERLGNGVCSRLTYEKKIFNQGYLETSVGYLSLIAESEDGKRQEDLTIIPIDLGIRYYIGKHFFLLGGATLNNFHLDTVHISPKPGGYIGMGLQTNYEKINFFTLIKRTFGDLDIDYALLEEASNMKGMFYGIGIRKEW